MEQRCYKIKYRVITFITACCREIYSAGSSHSRCRTGAVKQLMPALWQKLAGCAQHPVPFPSRHTVACQPLWWDGWPSYQLAARIRQWRNAALGSPHEIFHLCSFLPLAAHHGKYFWVLLRLMHQKLWDIFNTHTNKQTPHTCQVNKAHFWRGSGKEKLGGVLWNVFWTQHGLWAQELIATVVIFTDLHKIKTVKSQHKCEVLSRPCPLLRFSRQCMGAGEGERFFY